MRRQPCCISSLIVVSEKCSLSACSGPASSNLGKQEGQRTIEATRCGNIEAAGLALLHLTTLSNLTTSARGTSSKATRNRRLSSISYRPVRPTLDSAEHRDRPLALICYHQLASTMAYFEAQTDVLSMLHYQHRLYTSELAKSHGTLSKLYRKLERSERGLSEWQDRGLTRKDKKKLQWDRATAKTAARNAEAHQALLHEYLRQSNDLIASYAFQNSPGSWVQPLSPTAMSFAPDDPVPPTPWTAGPFEERTVWGSSSAPQYWDLSMLRERQSPERSGSPDSGYHEPARRGVTSGIEGSNELATRSSLQSVPSHESSLSDQDLLPELVTPSSPAKVGAEIVEIVESSHKRRFSENAIQMIESRLMANRSRVCSVPPPKRVALETSVSKEEYD
jgi:hypothetical protein